MKTFSDFHLPALLADQLERMSFTTPTPIQEQAIPPALEGRDILGSAQTGTGKTAAFMIPLVTKLLADERASALVMAPTRELAAQVMDMTKKLLGPKSGIRTALLIGGEPMPKQFKQLDLRPRIIIGTPGRINDHCRRNRALLDTTSFLVLDEADRMLDMGFSVQIDAVLNFMASERQTLMFSATFSDQIVKFAKTYLNNPVRVAVKAESISAERIQHNIIKLRGDEKFDTLVQELDERNGSVIIFVKTKRAADSMAKKLCGLKDEALAAEAIHGDLRQRQRDRTIRDFRAEKFRILVATDIAARGLDIPHIEHVINYDLPQVAEDYVHRIGRTARAGAEGAAVCFVTPSDGRMWREIEALLYPGQAKKFANDDGARGGQKGGYNKKPSFNKKPRHSDNEQAEFNPYKNLRKHKGPSSGFKGKGDYSKNDFGKKDSGQKEFGKKEFGKKDFSKKEFSDRDSFRKDGPKKDFGKKEFGKKDFAKKDFRKDGDRPERSSEDRARKPAFGQNAKPAARRDNDFKKSDRPYQGERSGGERGEGKFKPRQQDGERSFKPKRPDGERGFSKPKRDGDFGTERSRNFREKSHQPREADGNRRDRETHDPYGKNPKARFKSDGGYKPKSEGGYKGKSEGGYKPKSDGNRQDQPKKRFDKDGQRPQSRPGQGGPKKKFSSFGGASKGNMSGGGNKARKRPQ